MTRALDIAPESVPVLLVAASNEAAKLNWRDAMRYVERASRVSGKDIRIAGSYADISVKLGFPSRVLESWRRVQRLEPMVSTNYSLLAHTLIIAGNYEDANEYLERGWSTKDKLSHVANEGVTLALTLDDRDMLSIWLDRAIEAAPENGMHFYKSMLPLLDDRDAAVAQLHRWYEQGVDYDYFVALWAAYLDEPDLALESLQRSRDLWIFWLELLQDVRARDEFKLILADAGIVDTMREFGWNEFCEPLGTTEFRCR